MGEVYETVKDVSIEATMSLMGHKRTRRGQIGMCALPPKADTARRDSNVRFGPKTDIATRATVHEGGFVRRDI